MLWIHMIYAGKYITLSIEHVLNIKSLLKCGQIHKNLYNSKQSPFYFAQETSIKKILENWGELT